MTAIDDAWLATTEEEILEPDLPIVDPHHHLWDFSFHRYLLHELLQGHRQRSQCPARPCSVECGSMYRATGPEAEAPVGEVEFVNGTAAMSASGHYGETQTCAGIVGFADLTLGAAAEDVLQAEIAAGQRALPGHPARRRIRPEPGPCATATRTRRRASSTTRPSARASPGWPRSTSTFEGCGSTTRNSADVVGLARRLPGGAHRAGPCRRAARHRPLYRAP